ncbi:MAG: ABC transporter permease, partial [Oscillospiraceae bacterium]|nr:ABC transporter permease [Oscillospiraceae bacterium]
CGMKNIKSVFMKQLLDTVKNKTVFIQFLMFPVMAIIMENAIKIEDMPEHFFAKLFAVMFVGMAPLSCMSAIISEEKEKNTLRALMMCNVKPWQYLVSIGAYIFIMCMVGTAVFAVLTEYSGAGLARFVLSMISGVILSEIIGAVIGIFSRNQMAATSLTLPIMMVFSFLPMLSMFNESVKKVAGIIYSQQISDLINGIGVSEVSAKSIIIISANFIIGLVLFAMAYKKKGLE